MNLVITNTSQYPVPLSATRPDWVQVIGVEDELNVTQTNSVMIFGDKPGLKRQFEEAARILTESAAALLKAFEDRTAPDMPASGAIPVSALVTNQGTNAVRVILGDGVTDTQLDAGTSHEYYAAGYLEFRELGLAPQQGGTPD